MSLFVTKKKSVSGIDIGAGGIKIVELKRVKNRPQLHTYAFSEKGSGVTSEKLFDDVASVANFVKKMMRQARVTTTRTVAGLPIASVFSSIISVPKTNGKELKQAIEWQARKLIPLPLEEMVLDWKILSDQVKLSSTGRGLLGQRDVSTFITGKPKEGPPELGKKTMRILLTAAAKSLVSKYVELTKTLGLELLALETESFALIRSLIGKDPSSIMLIDFGTVRSTIVIVDQGIPVLTRSINLGGLSVSRAIANTLGIDEMQAEQMKRDIEKLNAFGGGEMPMVLRNTLEPLITEIKYSLNLYRTQQGDVVKNIEKIILTGGSAHLPYLSEYLSKNLNLNTFVGDPWARVATHEDLRPVLDEIGPRFAVAIGLAMRDFE